ncbi:hypothetical protein [Streptomyces vinaceus]|uniref:hypothetical protein n=1 Tax=Streptomyces vinaceus TaxID=1960 RepID=UPI0036B5BBA1
MDAASHLVVVAERSLTKKPEQVTPADVLALVFGEYRMRATDTEAAEVLAAALVARGHRVGCMPGVRVLAVTDHVGRPAAVEQSGGAR